MHRDLRANAAEVAAHRALEEHVNNPLLLRHDELPHVHRSHARRELMRSRAEYSLFIIQIDLEREFTFFRLASLNC
ncbi:MULTISPECIES: hypothetical protein [unclassified Bradyrhizobium]|uniref:hypothetical protein n=1 Tax=Bradyrhizobium sp. USDA 4541 TaxID=2817704 RepID=UPI0020A37128|nr:hypothetical protein [Bradyrhizobium sp. USDA 4541]MCP1854763.1 hypothetical protein [Bradyrhizobium sp. USDA 4541]